MGPYDTFIRDPLICESQTDSDRSKYRNDGKTEIIIVILSNLKLCRFLRLLGKEGYYFPSSLLEKICDRLYAWTFCVKKSYNLIYRHLHVLIPAVLHATL